MSVVNVVPIINFVQFTGGQKYLFDFNVFAECFGINSKIPNTCICSPKMFELEQSFLEKSKILYFHHTMSIYLSLLHPTHPTTKIKVGALELVHSVNS